MKKFKIFYHIATMQSWRQSHDIIKSYLYKNTILQNCNKIYFCINGDFKEAVDYIGENHIAEHEFLHLRNDYHYYEFPTINFMREKCLLEDINVLYLHTKGASRPVEKRNGRNNHLDNMCYNCIENYLECINKLSNNYDAVGFAYSKTPFPHFSGNIWWSKSEHIVKLKELKYGIRNFNKDQHPDRHDAEKWLCSEVGNFFNMTYYNKNSIYDGCTYADDDSAIIKTGDLPLPDKKLIDGLGFDFAKKIGKLKAIECGGPSAAFEQLNIYQNLISCDNIKFTKNISLLNKFAGDFIYCDKKLKGNLFWCDAVDMGIFETDSYELLLSSNNLEHIANPIKALYEWKRVIKNDGYIMLVLPRKESNFDHRRPITTFEHIIKDYNNSIKEDDMTHLEEILSLHDLERDPYAKPASWFEERSKDNITHRCLHHHVFDTQLIKKIFDYMKFETISIVNDYRNFYALAKNKK